MQAAKNTWAQGCIGKILIILLTIIITACLCSIPAIILDSRPTPAPLPPATIIATAAPIWTRAPSPQPATAIPQTATPAPSPTETHAAKTVDTLTIADWRQMDQTARQQTVSDLFKFWEQNAPGITTGVTIDQAAICITQYDIDANPPPTMLLMAIISTHCLKTPTPSP